MKKVSRLEQKRFIEALDIKQDDLFEAKFNLLGFFNALYKIDQRLKKEDDLKKLNKHNKD